VKIQDIWNMKEQVKEIAKLRAAHWIMVGIIGLMLAGCNGGVNGPKNAISGVFTGEGLGVEMQLRKWVPGINGKAGKFVSMGMATSTMEGQFELVAERPLVMDYYQLMVGNNSPMVIIMDSTMHVHIQADIPDGGFITNAKITGSKATAEVHEYYAKAMPMQTQLSMLRGMMQQTRDREKMQELSDQAASKKIEADNWAKQFLEDHPGSLASLGPLEHLEPGANGVLFEEVLGSTEEALREGSFHQALTVAIKGLVKKVDRRARVVKKGNGANKPRPSKNSRYGVGDEAPEIVMADPDGNERRLSDLRGKVVLIDFWASWCGPCRRENPNVVNAYNEFRSEGFEVFSVSLDQNADRWKAAISQDGLFWSNHVCDMQGWQNAAARSYGVSSIPHAVLVDQDGIIAATHLRGPALEAKLNELLR